MRRREYLAVCGGASLGTLAGCTRLNPSTAGEVDETSLRPHVDVDPRRPLVGEQVVFDASETEYDRDEELVYFWTDPDFDDFYNEGPTHQRRFEEAGRHAVEVWVTIRSNITRYDTEFGYGPDLSSSSNPTSRETITVEVQELDDEGLDVSSEAVNILLKADRQAVETDSAASLTFSATNLLRDEALTIQLIIQVPSGLLVNESSYQQGGGQFTSVYDVAEGDTVSDRLRVEATDPGPYTVSASAVYYFDEEDRRRTETNDIELRFFE